MTEERRLGFSQELLSSACQSVCELRSACCSLKTFCLLATRWHLLWQNVLYRLIPCSHSSATADLTVFFANNRNLNLQYIFEVDSITSLQISVTFRSYLAVGYALSTCEERFYADRCKMVNEHS